MNLESQYLVEYETKLDAVQKRLDWYQTECFNETEIPKELVSEFYRLLKIVQRLKKEVQNVSK